MKRWAARIGAALLVLIGVVGVYALMSQWTKGGSAPSWVTISCDRLTTLVGGVDPHTRCYLPVERTPEGFTVQDSRPDRQCYDWQQARRFRGIFIDEFEGQRFIENAQWAPPLRPQDDVWLQTDEKTDFAVEPSLKQQIEPTRIWLVDFLGGKTAQPGRYGHMGASPDEVLVDRFISAKLVYEQPGYLPDRLLAR